MSLIDMDGALVQAYLDLNLDLPTAYEGVDFAAEDKADAWASVFFLPAGTSPITLGVGGQDEHAGIMQIDFNVKPGTGRADLLTFAQAVMDEFVSGKWYSRGAQDVLIESVDRSSIRTVEGWMRVSLSVNWLSRTTRPEI